MKSDYRIEEYIKVQERTLKKLKESDKKTTNFINNVNKMLFK